MGRAKAKSCSKLCHFAHIIILSPMERIQQKMKLIIDWSIGKKKHIHELVINHLSVYRHIKSFIDQYISHLQDLLKTVERASTESYNAKDPQTMIDLFGLIKTREKNNIESWKSKMSILESKYRGEGSSTTAGMEKKFPDIFKDIDQDISYYGTLRNKMKELILKKSISETEKMKDQYEIGRHSPFKANPQKITGKYLKINRFAELYDNKYLHQLNSPKQYREQKGQPRQVGRIRGNYSPRKSSQYSAYKLVNPRYSPMNIKDRSYQTDREYSLSISEQTLPRSSTDNPKYQKHKVDLRDQMYQAKKNESLAVHTPNKMHKNNDRADYSTANSNKDACESFNSRKVANVKKYTYLFDDDQELEQSYLSNQQRVKRILFEDPHKSIMIPCLQNNDSLQLHDELGTKLEVDATGRHKQEVDLEQVLASSLLSSKKWDSRDQVQLSDDDSEKDSLDELSNNIASTGKFPSLARDQQRYGNENRLNEDEGEDEMSYPYRTVNSSASKLNFSFGSP